jgi:hypothetical protein
MTTGTATFKDGKILTLEQVVGNANGITEVRGTSEITPEGALHVTTEYFKAGEWVPGREVTYQEHSASTVLFR